MLTSGYSDPDGECFTAGFLHPLWQVMIASCFTQDFPTPGQVHSRYRTLKELACALYLPLAGLPRALRSLHARRKTLTSPLERALHASALCEIVKIPQNSAPPYSDKRPASDEENIQPPTDSTLFLPAAQSSTHKGTKRHVHGTCVLPNNYALRLLPRDHVLTPASSLPLEFDSPAADRVFLRAAVVQLAYTVYILTCTPKAKLAVCGYTHWALIVLPWLGMAVANLGVWTWGGCWREVWVVRTAIMDEAAERGGVFEGVIENVVKGAAEGVEMIAAS